jgi:hypothetical protein
LNGLLDAILSTFTLQEVDYSVPWTESFNGKPQATAFSAIADAFGLPLNDFGCGFAASSS